jgi:hypothetical protein
MVSVGTIQKAITGDILFAPCLKDLEEKKEQAEESYPSESPA